MLGIRQSMVLPWWMKDKAAVVKNSTHTKAARFRNFHTVIIGQICERYYSLYSVHHVLFKLWNYRADYIQIREQNTLFCGEKTKTGVKYE